LEENHTYKSLAAKYLKVAEEGRRPVEESARWAASPFWVGFNIVIVLGLVTHFLFPAVAPHLFHNGIITFLKDPHTYHQIALKAVDLPWIEFSFRPEGQFPAGILALIYKFTGIHKPFMLLPILAVLAGLSIRGIASCLDVLGVKGRWWPIIIGLLFTITPTSISWMIYPHKDAFIVPGVILIAWTFMAVTLRRIRLRHVLSLILGSILVFTSKPYFAELFAVGAALAIPFAWRQPASQLGRYGRLSFLMIALFLFGAIAYLKKGYSDAGEGVPQDITNNQNSVPTKDSLPRHIQTKANWKSLPLGLSLNKALLALAYTRERFLFQRSHGNTNFLSEIHLEGAWDTIKFIPKALQLSLFEPLPWRQVEGGIARKLIFLSAQLEMLLVYFSIFFLIASGKKSWSPAVIICIALAVPFLIALGFAAPNIGAINRYRFPFLVLIKIAGFAALWNSNRFKWPGRLLMWVDPPRLERKKNKVMFLVPDDQTFVIQRLVMAQGIQKAGYEVHVACPDLGHAASIRELGFIHHHIDLNRGGLNPLADFKAFIKLVFFLAKERPDILHNVSIKPVIYGATAGSIVGLKRIVCLINGLGYAFEAKTFKGKLVLYVAKALYKNALALPGVRVIFQNPDDREYFIKENLVEEHKTILIRGSGVNTKKFYPTPQPQNLKPVVLFVGRLLRSKGVEDLIAAARILKNEKIDFDLQFVGEPDERNPESLSWTDLKKIEDEGLCKLLGRQNDMPHFYREADIVVLPQQNREGLPLTLLEASSSARSIVTTDVPGCREVVLDQVNGLKVPPMNPEKLANAIRILIENPQMRERFGRSGAEIVQKEFSANIIEAQLVKVYESLLNDSVPLKDNQVLCSAIS
jgi:glycosyltransferase involved in cell wall biosynthesis